MTAQQGSSATRGVSETAKGATVASLPGTLDGAIDRLALCTIPAEASFEDEGAPTATLHHVLHGRIEAEIAGKRLSVPASSVLLLPARTPVRLSPGGRSTKDARVLMASVSPIAATALGLDVPHPPVVQGSEGLPGGVALSDMLIQELVDLELGSTLVIAGILKLYLVAAARQFAERQPAGAESRIDRTVTAILARPGASHSIASLADEARMSRATFIRHFHRLTGMNPMQYVTKARLDHAAQLLRTTQLPVKVIAAQIGFQNHSHFSRAFRTAHGTDPSNFRRSETSGERRMTRSDAVRSSKL